MALRRGRSPRRMHAKIDIVSITDYCSRMSYIVDRREEEKERRRAEILDAAEALYAKKGWDAVTVDQVARSARLSRGLVYVYFHDKEDLLFAIGERAMRLLRDRFHAAVTRSRFGIGAGGSHWPRLYGLCH